MPDEMDSAKHFIRRVWMLFFFRMACKTELSPEDILVGKVEKQREKKESKQIASGCRRKTQQIKCLCYLNAITWVDIVFWAQPIKTELFSVTPHCSCPFFFGKWNTIAGEESDSGIDAARLLKMSLKY